MSTTAPALPDLDAFCGRYLAVQLGFAPAPGSRVEKGMAALQCLGARVAARRRK